MNKRIIDIVGNRYGKLLVKSFSHLKGKQTFWNCQCDCEKQKIIDKGSMIRGSTKSCGCLRFSCSGLCGTRIYMIWNAMLARCNNPKNKRFKNYGGRGIQVCDRWKTFINFYNDMGKPPNGKQIDRIDNDGNYSPENCRWVTRKENANNKTINKFIRFQNKTLTIAQWAEIKKINKQTLYTRFAAGWPTKEALNKNSTYRKKVL